MRLDWPDKTAILCPLCSQLSRSIRLLAPYLSLEIGLSGPWPKALGGRATSIPRQPLFLFWLPASLLGLTGHWPPAFSTAKTPLSPQSIKTVTQTSLFLCSADHSSAYVGMQAHKHQRWKNKSGLIHVFVKQGSYCELAGNPVLSFRTEAYL